MDEKYPRTCAGILDFDAEKWYEAEKCWNCEPEELRGIQTRKKRSVRKWLVK